MKQTIKPLQKRTTSFSLNDVALHKLNVLSKKSLINRSRILELILKHTTIKDFVKYVSKDCFAVIHNEPTVKAKKKNKFKTVVR